MNDVEEVPSYDVERNCSIGGCRRHAARKPLLAVAGWLAAAVAALAVAAIPYDFDESLCGVWGCFPPIPALVAMHLLWCVGFGAAIHAIATIRTCLLRPLGLLMILAAALTTVVVVGNDLTHWLEIPGHYRSYWPMRLAYIIAINTDIPLVQSFVAGVTCLAIARSRLRSPPMKCDPGLRDQVMEWNS